MFSFIFNFFDGRHIFSWSGLHEWTYILSAVYPSLDLLDRDVDDFKEEFNTTFQSIGWKENVSSPFPKSKKYKQVDTGSAAVQIPWTENNFGGLEALLKGTMSRDGTCDQ